MTWNELYTILKNILDNPNHTTKDLKIQKINNNFIKLIAHFKTNWDKSHTGNLKITFNQSGTVEVRFQIPDNDHLWEFDQFKLEDKIYKQFLDIIKETIRNLKIDTIIKSETNL